MRLALTGNPNSGKTTMYNALTGRNEKVANWAGVTVEKKEHPVKKGYYAGDMQLIAVDLPGAYSMSPFTSEESITSSYVKKENPDVIINIVDEDYITAAISYSENDYRIITRYVLPNAVGPVIVYATMSISATILTAAGLSFIGMGVQPPTPEWGYMISEAQGSMRYASYLIMFPGFALLLASLAFNLLGDGLQDALDPKMRD